MCTLQHSPTEASSLAKSSISPGTTRGPILSRRFPPAPPLPPLQENIVLTPIFQPLAASPVLVQAFERDSRTSTTGSFLFLPTTFHVQPSRKAACPLPSKTTRTEQNCYIDIVFAGKPSSRCTLPRSNSSGHTFFSLACPPNHLCPPVACPAICCPPAVSVAAPR